MAAKIAALQSHHVIRYLQSRGTKAPPTLAIHLELENRSFSGGWSLDVGAYGVFSRYSAEYSVGSCWK